LATDLLQAIQSLNSQSFSDYQHLIFDLKEVITNYDAESRKKVVQDRNLQDYEFRGNSIDYIKEVYNKKLSEFVSNFFWEKELIRKEVSSRPGVLKEVYLDSFNYFWPIPPNQMEPLDRPSTIDSANVRTTDFNKKYKSDYFLNPRPAPKKSNEGCFIATYAFDSYEHNNVQMLRRYRDEYLSKNNLGKEFIQYYYRYSPTLVKFCEVIKFPKVVIQKFLIGYLWFLRVIQQKKI